MKISVRVKPNAKKDKVEKISEDEYVVFVKAKPRDGKANYAVREALADHFDIARSRVVLITGEKSKKKIFSIIS
ncbi:MAG: DUF167 domain-containing protein [Candidatus Omnitrophota bacterium]|nr:DUF167 domain-containing protein [Candidatus Omnitrophota bacterium]